MLAGLDEVGRGALAGPMVVVVAAFQQERAPIRGLRDSKKLRPARRLELAPFIMKSAAWWSIGLVVPAEIDHLGMTAAWQLACERALEGSPAFECLMIDGIDRVNRYQGAQRSVIQGDDQHWQISAASILAKVLRDLEMHELHERHPGYAWDRNKGYGSAQHYRAIKELGVTPEHRALFLRNLNTKERP